MLPCRSTCAAFHSGCHKDCLQWRRFQEEQRAQREAKKRYLQYHVLRCAQAARQYQAIQVRRPAW